MLSLIPFSCMLLFAGIVVMQNNELDKIFPPSTARTLTILFGYIVAIISYNYALATKGNNFMGWKNEALIIIGFIIVFIGMFLPHAFPTTDIQVNQSWIPFMSSETEKFKPNWIYAIFTLLSLPFFYKAWQGIKRMPLWCDNK